MGNPRMSYISRVNTNLSMNTSTTWITSALLKTLSSRRKSSSSLVLVLKVREGVSAPKKGKIS